MSFALFFQENINESILRLVKIMASFILLVFLVYLYSPMPLLIRYGNKFYVSRMSRVALLISSRRFCPVSGSSHQQIFSQHYPPLFRFAKRSSYVGLCVIFTLSIIELQCGAWERMWLQVIMGNNKSSSSFKYSFTTSYILRELIIIYYEW